ncbi:histidinol-phosphate transaminase [Microcoleus sp. FACHB-831]|uniref:histidinol-phosphate transaminase n=1 Tax=Microcoleus sp. FACHB-831 TaxID=2692827 RepID=UPI001686E324|nr:histidinol-phosphate transaminase [Microcoleus sp. FACHB-831]MBD1923148.1 histidinol-phosphate transaminase [Microcoleus sp. FACHB-831]
MLSFIRSDIAQLTAYTPHPGGASGSPALSSIAMDRLDTNECPYDLPSELKEKLAWTYQQLIEANRYPDGGHEAIREAIAEYVNESLDKPLTAANISVGNGSDELIRSLLIATCLGGEGSILVANPTFSMYGILAKTLGIPVVSVGRSEANFEIDLAAAQAAIEQSQNPPIRVVFVVHPNSPTANALTAKELEWLRSLPQEILVVIDEAYFEFSQTSVAGELAQHPNWVVLRTFSKAFRLAAHRVGYAIAHPELIAALEKIRLPYNLPSFTQAAAQLALTHRKQLLAVIPEIRANRDKLIQALSGHPALQVWPSDANFIYLRLVEPFKDDALTHLAQNLKAQGTLVRHIAGGLRITVGSVEENARSLSRLQTLLEASPSASPIPLS